MVLNDRKDTNARVLAKAQGSNHFVHILQLLLFISKLKDFSFQNSRTSFFQMGENDAGEVGVFTDPGLDRTGPKTEFK